ncbi:hypothetical protein IJJ46_01180 [Candidatus Saccharibacteria bacterium]|nr:hypothetical protein [Candidatus Saccharibacteria bacterium]
MKKLLKKLFGGLDFTWPRLIIFAVIMGIYTALVAMIAPDGSSFHDIAVTTEWWVLPAILIIVNTKSPLESALKTFVFFLISQPLVYLCQVPFNDMGWGLFGYYRYWFMVTLLTFPAAFVGWFIKKDKWYSALILSAMTALLVFTGVNYVIGLKDNFPNHLLSIIYCFGIIPVFIFGIFKEKKTRIISAIVAFLCLVANLGVYAMNKPFEMSSNSFIVENNITFVGEPYISSFISEGQGRAELVGSNPDYAVKMSGISGKNYYFEITDDENTYSFKYYYDKTSGSVVVEKVE